MTASATALTREKAERAWEDCEYVRSLLNVRQPQFAAVLESAARKLVRDHGTVCASSQRSSQPGWGLLGAAGRPAALPAGQTCELRVGPEFFYLGSDAGTLTARRGPAPGGDAVVTMSADTLYRLLTGETTVTGAARHSNVDGDTAITRPQQSTAQEHVMSLSHHHQKQLHLIQAGLLRSDPQLAARLSMFGRLSAGQAMPAWERVSSRPDRIRQAAALIAEAISVVAAAIFLFLRAVLALVAAVVQGSRARAPAQMREQTRPRPASGRPAGPGGRG